jgi:hypothetical protein
MSTLPLALRPGLLGIPTERATSKTAIRVSNDIAAALESFKAEPLATGAGYQSTLAELDSLTRECSSAGWDGYDARPVDVRSVALARRLILALPAAFHSPLVAAYPDGEVALTWKGADGTDLSISVGPAGLLSYAGVFGASVVAHGSENFADDLPETILDQFRRLR